MATPASITSAAQARAVARGALARVWAFTDAHRGQAVGYEAAELSAACAELEQSHDLLAGAGAVEVS